MHPQLKDDDMYCITGASSQYTAWYSVSTEWGRQPCGNALLSDDQLCMVDAKAAVKPADTCCCSCQHHAELVVRK